MSLIRKYKISKITNIVLTDKQQEIIDFASDYLKDLKLHHGKRTNTESWIVYLNDDNEFIFEIVDNKTAIVRNENFWEVLNNEYSMNDNDIRALFQYLVNKNYNLKIEQENITIAMSTYIKIVENFFK